MATKLYLTNTASDLSTGGECLKVGVATKGAGLSTGTTDTITSAASVVQLTRDTTSDVAITWYTAPLNAVLIVAATVTLNYWMAESNMSANVQACTLVSVVDAAGGLVASIIPTTGVPGSELPVTTRAAQNWTPGGSNQNVGQGQRIRIQIYGAPIGTMASGFTFNAGWGGTTDAADGDTWVQVAETVTEAPSSRVPRSPGVDSGFGHLCKAWQATRRWRHGQHGILVPDITWV